MPARRRIRVRARPLAYSLRALAAAGERLPRVAVGRYTVGLDKTSNRLMVKSDEAYLGVIMPTDVWRVSNLATQVDITSVKMLVERFVEIAAGAAALSADNPRCAICGRPIGAKPEYKEDRVRGIGKVCWVQGEFDTFERRAIAGRKKRSKIKTQSRKTTKTRRRKHG